MKRHAHEPAPLNRRHFCCTLGAAAITAAGARFSQAGTGVSHVAAPATPSSVTPAQGLALYDEALRSVVPPEGFRSRIALGTSVTNLVQAGVIDVDRFQAAYDQPPPALTAATFRLPDWEQHHATDFSGGLSEAMRYHLRWPAKEPIHLTKDNAGVYLNLLWPLGLANRIATNEYSPILGENLTRFASTAGWTLGREANGSAYFNSLDVVKLTEEQEVIAVYVADRTFRPCCNNSTFFQDCNHGSALLGLLQLGAAQGLDANELFHEALGFNALWFPDKYVSMALYFKIFQGLDWDAVDPRIALDYRYSAILPWRANVNGPLASVPNLPTPKGASSCSI